MSNIATHTIYVLENYPLKLAAIFPWANEYKWSYTEWYRKDISTPHWSPFYTALIAVKPHIRNRAIMYDIPRCDSRFAPSQCETSSQSNAVSHWLRANLESELWYYTTMWQRKEVASVTIYRCPTVVQDLKYHSLYIRWLWCCCSF